VTLGTRLTSTLYYSSAAVNTGAGIVAGGARTDGVVVWLTYCVGCISNQILCDFVLTCPYQPLWEIFQ